MKNKYYTTVLERKPVPHGLSQCLNYVNDFQQKEFEAQLLKRRVEELPIAMLIQALCAKVWHYNNVYNEFYGLVQYIPKNTDKKILASNLHTGIVYKSNFWNTLCSYFAIDWKHSVLIGEKTESFAGKTVKQFIDMVHDAKFKSVPKTDTMDTHHLEWPYPVQGEEDVQLHHGYHNLPEELADDQPWYMLPEEYKQYKKLRDAKKPKEQLKDVLKRQAGRIVIERFWTTFPDFFINLTRIENVELTTVGECKDKIGDPAAWWSRKRHDRAYNMFGIQPRMTTREAPPDSMKVVKVSKTVLSGTGMCMSYEVRNTTDYIPLDIWTPYDSPERTCVNDLYDFDGEFAAAPMKCYKAILKQVSAWKPLPLIGKAFKSFTDAFEKWNRMGAMSAHPGHTRDNYRPDDEFWADKWAKDERDIRYAKEYDRIQREYGGERMSDDPRYARAMKSLRFQFRETPASVLTEADLAKIASDLYGMIGGKAIQCKDHDYVMKVDRVMYCDHDTLDLCGIMMDSIKRKAYYTPCIIISGHAITSDAWKTTVLPAATIKVCIFRDQAKGVTAENIVKDNEIVVVKPKSVLDCATRTMERVTRNFPAFVSNYKKRFADLLDGKPLKDERVLAPSVNFVSHK